MIVDEAEIYVRSGKGGDGCVAFHRAKYVPKGGPAGGSGGRGGDLIMEACDNVDTLLDFAGRHHWMAEDGRMGGGKQCDGPAGEDLVVRVPVGTLVYDRDSGVLIADLKEIGQREVICHGGKGGKGNMYFATATNQAPDYAEPGVAWEEKNLKLELKLIADVGLLGFPNAGKSTLLTAVSAARPKVANYPFTTLSPHPGIAELSGGRRFVIADIPGLIPDAADGAGLGIRFLKHVERTSLLIHLIEVAPLDEADPIDHYHAIRQELAKYSQELSQKPEIVVVSKIDLCADSDKLDDLAERLHAATGHRPVLISSVARLGLNELLEKTWQCLGKRPPEEENPWPKKG